MGEKQIRKKEGVRGMPRTCKENKNQEWGNCMQRNNNSAIREYSDHLITFQSMVSGISHQPLKTRGGEKDTTMNSGTAHP